MIHEMPAAFFTCSVGATSSMRSVITIVARRFPVFLHFVRVVDAISGEAEYGLINNSSPLAPITSGSTEVAGVNYTPGAETAIDVVDYQAFTGLRANTSVGLLGTPAALKAPDSAGLLAGIPTIIPPRCSLFIVNTTQNEALQVTAHGSEVRYSYEIDGLTGYPVPRRIRR